MYNQEYGVDLLQKEIEAQTKAFSKLNIDDKTIRMDSLMVGSFCKKIIPAGYYLLHSCKTHNANRPKYYTTGKL